MFRYHFSSEIDNVQQSQPTNGDKASLETKLGIIRKDIIGSSSSSGLIESPLDHKHREIVYADYTASGRSLGSIESFIQNRVLPFYGNTHSVSSATARQTTYFREEARHVISNYFNCTEENAVIFAGAGVTGAMAKFLALMEAGMTEGFLFGSVSSGDSREYLVEDRWGSLMCRLCNVRVKNSVLFRSHCHTALHLENVVSKLSTSNNSSVSKKKIVFIVDPMSHHSSLLPVREFVRKFSAPNQVLSIVSLSPCEIVAFCASLDPSILPIAVLCAMSNITGLGPSDSEIFSVNAAVHEHGGLVAWDLATYICHRRFDMNPVGVPLGYSDFAFVSSHKLLGGPGASGLLLARRRWMRNSVPTMPGGGVVFFASAAEQSYIQNSAEREEAGTPDIVGCIRAGLVFRLQSQFDLLELEQVEKFFSEKILSVWRKNQKIQILRCDDQNAVTSPIISFNIIVGNRHRLLHHNFVVALLNDLFGIQARGGCACAGPYAQHLLGFTAEKSAQFHKCLQQSGQEIFRPGFIRVGVHWAMDPAEVDLLTHAVNWIAENGWMLLAEYKVDLATGEWEHRSSHMKTQRDWLSGLDFWDERSWKRVEEKECVSKDKLLEQADEVILATIGTSPKPPIVIANLLDQRFADLVWFALPSDKLTTAECEVSSPTKEPSPDETSEQALLPPMKKSKKFQVPRKLRAAATQAIIDFKMINPGDKILVGVSGGKDSLSLLHVLLDCKRKCPFPFEVAAATVDPQVPEYQPGALKEYMRSLGVTYHYLSQPIVEIAKTAMTGKQSICAFCSRMKRGMLYSCMRIHGYNVLALGQHLDDLVESFLMSCFRNGAMRTMKANYFVKEKDLRVIRPFVYVRERMTAAFAHEAQLPIIRENCPACFSAPKERHRIKMLLSTEEFENPHLFASMLQSMKPLIGISSAMSTKELIERNIFPFQNACDEEDDQGAEETLLPCGTDGVCPLPE